MERGSADDDSDRWPSADLLLVVVSTGLAGCVVGIDPLRTSTLAWAVVLPYSFFVPGYAIVSMLYPSNPTALVPNDAVDGGPADPRVGLLGRAVLSIGGSVGVIAVVGITLDFTVFGFQRIPLFTGVALFTLAAVVIAGYRRQRTHEPAGVDRAAVRDGLLSIVGRDTTSRVLSLVVLVSVLGAAGGIAATQTDTPTTRSASLLADADGGGAADYSRDLLVGQATEYTLAVDNGASEPLTGTVIVQLQTAEVGETVRVTRRTELQRVTVQVPPNERELLESTVVPTEPGERRLAFLVFFGAVPETPTTQNADREVHLWITVTPEGEQ
jgi:uncharacterized membrane protein